MFEKILHPTDFSEFIAASLDDINAIKEVGGPEVFSYNELTQMAFEAIGKPLSECQQQKCWHLMHGPDHNGPPPNCPFEKVLETGVVQTEEMEAHGGYYIVSCTPQFDNSGQIEKVIHTATDITSSSATLRGGSVRHPAARPTPAAALRVRLPPCPRSTLVTSSSSRRASAREAWARASRSGA